MFFEAKHQVIEFRIEQSGFSVSLRSYAEFSAHIIEFIVPGLVIETGCIQHFSFDSCSCAVGLKPKCGDLPKLFGVFDLPGEGFVGNNFWVWIRDFSESGFQAFQESGLPCSKWV